MICRFYITVILLLVCACEAPSAKSDVYIKKGDQIFVEKLKKMEHPTGILPLRFRTGNDSDIIFQSEDNCHSYFVFDKKNVLMILSDNPLYFIGFSSKEFYFHLLSEYSQLSKKIRPDKKNANSVPVEYEYGNKRVMLAFIPNEVRYSSRGGEIIDINSEESNDPEKLISLATELGMFSPDFKEERIYSILVERIKNMSLKLTQVVSMVSFAPEFDSSYITYHIEPNLPFGFSFFVGEKLVVDEEELEEISDEDFIIFCTVPLGNSQKHNESYLSKTESGRNGFMLTIRGNINEFKDFLSKEGFPFDNAGELPVSLVLDDKFDEGLVIDCSSRENLYFTMSINEGAEVPCEVLEIDERRYLLKKVIRGSKYRIRAWRSNKMSELVAESQIYCPEIIISEIMFWGSSYRKNNGANDDDWIEILNVGSEPINLCKYDFVIKNTALTRKFWFGPSNQQTISYDALNLNLDPGERCVVALMIDDCDGIPGEFYFDAGCFPVDSKIVKRGTLSKNSIGKGYEISVYNNEKLVTRVVTGDKFGSKLPFASMVRQINGDFETSKNDSGYPAGVVYEKRNFCSPGYAAPGEM